jgi:hypothetical protein
MECIADRGRSRAMQKMSVLLGTGVDGGLRNQGKRRGIP